MSVFSTTLRAKRALFLKKGSLNSQETLKITRRNLLREKRKAKRKWQAEFAEKCQKKDFRTNPKEAWQMVRQLMNGFQKHHKPLVQKLFKNKMGKIATNKTENRLNVESHWKNVFNRHATYDEKIIEEIEQRSPPLQENHRHRLPERR